MWNLYHLKYFVDSAKNLSITEAAKLNHVSASAISQAIRSLESELNVTLLKHQKKNYLLTPAGRALLTEATSVFESIDNLKKRVSRGRRQLSGPLTLVCSNSVAQTILPELLGKLRKTHPEIQPVLFTANARRTHGLLSSRQVELALAVHEAPLSAFENKLLLQGRFTLVKKRGVPSLPLRGQSFILGDFGEEVDAFRVQFRRKFGAEPRVFMEAQSWMASISFCEAGLGTALLPDFLIRRKPSLVAVTHPLSLSTYRLNLYFRREESISGEAEAFIAACSGWRPHS